MMRSRVFVTGAAACLAIGAAVLALEPGDSGQKPSGTPAADAPGQRGPGGQGGPKGPEGSVESGMRTMNRAAKQLSKQIGDASKLEENLKLINDMQRGCVMAKGLPVPAEILTKVKDPQIRVKFHAHLLGVLRALVEIETSITEGKGEDAKAKLSEVIKLRDAAHTELGVGDD